LLGQRSVHFLRRFSILSVVLAAVSVSLHAAEPSGKKALVNGWEHRSVVLKRALYSIVYDERSRFLPIATRDGVVTGLTVTTPSDTYYQFDARRDSEEDIIAGDPDDVVSMVRKQYHHSMHLDIGTVQDVEPLMLVRYEPGVKLFVSRVQIERDRVRLYLHKDRNGDIATTLTVKWPVRLSKELAESALIADLLGRFVATE
jgi:hypothetical protein